MKHHAQIEKLKPQLVVLSHNGFTTIGVEKPKTTVYMSVVVSKRIFDKTAEYEYKNYGVFSEGKTLWVGGMQNRIVNEVQIITDNIKSGLFVVANFQNDPKFPFLFAKLIPCELYNKVQIMFVEFARKLKGGLCGQKDNY